MKERLSRLITLPEAAILAKQDGQHIGYTYLFPNESDVACVMQGWTGVRPECRRQGIATALKAHGVEYAMRQGFPRLVTKIRSDNLASIRLNEKFGFRQIETPMESG